MSTDTTLPPTETPASTEGVLPSPTQQGTETLESARPESSAREGIPLPPRVDGGENLDEVLGEVSRTFAKEVPPAASPVAAPLPAENSTPAETPAKSPPSPMATDEIDDQLSDMAGDAPPREVVGSSGTPNLDMSVGSTADLFRAGEETSKPPDRFAESPAPFAPGPFAPGTDQSGADGPFSPSPISPTAEPAPTPPRGSESRFRRLSARAPKAAKLSAAIAGVAAVMVVGWMAWTHRPHSHAASSEHQSNAAVEASAEPGSHESNANESSPQPPDIEAQLQKALRERDEAQRERALALARLQQLETRAAAAAPATHGSSSGEKAAGQQLAREQSARRIAEENYRRAQEHVRQAQLRTYNVQLARVRDDWRTNPGLAVMLLEDAERCPPARRDFTWGYFYSRAKNDRLTLAGHAPLNAIVWFPDGRQIVTADQDGQITFRDATSGQQLAKFPAHAGGAAGIALSASGELLASAGADGCVKLWNVKSRAIVGAFFGHLGSVNTVAIAAEGSTLVSGGEDGTVMFWDVAARRATATRWGSPRGSDHSNNPTPVRCVSCSPDGRLVAAGGDHVVRIWDVAGAAEKGTLSIPDGLVTALAFSPDGAELAAGAMGTIYRWKLDTMTRLSEPLAIDGPVNDLKYSADGRLLAAAGRNESALFRVASQSAGALETAPAVAKSAEANPEADLVGSHRPVTLGRTELERIGVLRLRGHVGAVTGVALSPDAQTVATCGEDGAVRLWDSQQSASDKSGSDLILSDQPNTLAIAYSSDGKWFASASAETIHVRSLADGTETSTIKNRAAEIKRIALSPNGTMLAAASTDWPILIWDLAAQRVKFALNGHTGGVNTTAYFPDGKSLISAGDDGTVRIWDAAAGRETALLTGHTGPVLSAAIAPDGKLAASGGSDGQVKLWDVATRRATATLAGHSASVATLAFSPDGRFLVSAESATRRSSLTVASSDRRPICIWRMPKGELVARVATVGSPCRDVAFTPDGKTLATSDREGIALWDAETFEPRETLRFGEKGPLFPLAFSPDGRTLAAASEPAIVFWTAAPYAPMPNAAVNR